MIIQAQAAPSWFDKDYYLESKLDQLKAAGETKYVYPVDVEKAIVAAGFTVYDHFDKYSIDEGTNPNEWFNTNEYLAAKAFASGLTVPALVAAIKAAGMSSAYEHFSLWGWKEGINPSNAFDLSSYLDAKAEQAEMTVAELTVAIEKAGLDPISHFKLYGKIEAEAAAQSWVVPVSELEQVQTGSDNLTALLARWTAAQKAEADALAAVAAEDAANDIDEGAEPADDSAEALEEFVADYNDTVDDAQAELDEAVAKVGAANTAYETAIGALADARIIKTDASLAAELAAAEKAVADDKVPEIGAAALLAAYNAAVAAEAADVTANGEKLALASTLNDAIALYLSQNTDLSPAGELGDVQSAYLAVVNADPDDLAAALTSWADAIDAAVDAINVTEDDDTGELVDGARADAVIAALTPVTERLDLEAAIVEALLELSSDTDGGNLLDAREASALRAKLIANIPAAAEDLADATDYAEELEAIVQAYNDAADETDLAQTALGNDWAIREIGVGPATNDNDVFVFKNGQDGQIDFFGDVGADLISFAAGKYTLVKLDAAPAGKPVGSVSALEIFVFDDAEAVTPETILYVETNAFDGNSTNSQASFTEITLVGVTDQAVTMNAAGYLTVAAPAVG